jgi:fluoroacetyl-CoA thioesterase
MTFVSIQPGLRGEANLIVAREHTAQHLGSGGVEVLATPQMVLLMERAGVAAVDPLLPEGYRTVGAHLDIRHLAPTPAGFEVRATAELIEVDGRRLTFRVQVHELDGGGEGVLVGEGTHQRFIVDVQRFAEQVAEKTRKRPRQPVGLD